MNNNMVTLLLPEYINRSDEELCEIYEMCCQVINLTNQLITNENRNMTAGEHSCIRNCLLLLELCTIVYISRIRDNTSINTTTPR